MAQPVKFKSTASGILGQVMTVCLALLLALFDLTIAKESVAAR